MKKKYLVIDIGTITFIPITTIPVFQPQTKQSTHIVKLDTPGKSPLVKRIKTIQQNGVRPRFSPDGKLIVFDCKNEDWFYDVYLSDLEGKIIRNLTIAPSGLSPGAVLPQRNNGNVIFHPSRKHLIFISEEENHTYKFTKWASDSGLGTFSNFWAATPDESRFWQPTNIRIKGNVFNKIPSFAVVNPYFSHNGPKIVWTGRYTNQEGYFSQNPWRMAGKDS